MSEKNYSLRVIQAICEDLIIDGFAVVSEKELLEAFGIEAAQHSVQRTADNVPQIDKEILEAWQRKRYGE